MNIFTYHIDIIGILYNNILEPIFKKDFQPIKTKGKKSNNYNRYVCTNSRHRNTVVRIRRHVLGEKKTTILIIRIY